MYEKRLETKSLYKGMFLNFVEDKVELDDEHTSLATRQYIVHPGGVCVVPVLENKKIVLVEQYRTPVDKVVIEIPAGKIDPGEHDTLATAKRELREETGYTASKWTKMADLLPCPGYSTETLYLYLAQDLLEGKQDLDEGEIVETLIVDFKEAFEMIAQGKIDDSKTINGIYMAAQILSNLN